MTEEVKVRVTQERGGPNVLRETMADLQAVQKASGGSGGGGGHGGGGFQRGRFMNELVTLIRESASGAPSGRSFGALAGAAGIGRILMHPAVLAAVAATAVAKTYYSQKDQDIAIGNRLREEKAADQRSLSRAAAFSTSPDQFMERGLNIKDQIAALQDERKTLVDQAQSGIFGRLDKAMGSNFFTKRRGFFAPASARAIEQNDAETARLQTQSMQEEEERKKKYAESTGLENDAIRAEINRDRKGARAAQDKAAWWKAYRAEYHANGGDSAGAIAVADMKDTLIKRDRAALFGQVLGARSGARDIARVAMMAAGYAGGAHPDSPEIAALRSDMNQNHEEAKGAWFTQKFSRP